MAFSDDRLAEHQLVGRSDLVEEFSLMYECHKWLSNKHLEFSNTSSEAKQYVLFPFLFFLISVLHPNNAGRPVWKKGNVVSPFQTLSPSWKQPLLVLGCFFWLGGFMYFSVLSSFLAMPRYTWFSWWPLWPEMDIRPMLTKWQGTGSPFSYPPCYSMDLLVMPPSSCKCLSCLFSGSKSIH